ncbi:protein RGF1 INDUCIBLE TRANSCRIPTION FACTOR 1-like isoform X2 [Phaseolus vulgaris]|uniref:protein RGF1 INDUCIBLE TRANSCRIPTION FACTOR 1-like isoform X2 n=1 Tax=Phaseolus vulgaris TaxID=3885 RepID=UPI0035CB615B
MCCLLFGAQVGFNSVPNWLLILKEEKFFTRCLSHGSLKKNEKNIFCLDCCTSICLHCLPFHRSHVLLQIRRYMYNDVLRLGDAKTVLNCSLVQPYTTNKTKVVFLKQRPRTRSHKGSTNLCITCDRNLQDPYIFCSLSCKVHQHLLLVTKSTTAKGTCNKYEFSVLLDKERSSENTQQIEDSQITTDSVLDSPTVSGSTSSNGEGGVAESVNESLKKKRVNVDTVPEIWYTMINRRKGVPHRSPLY